MRVRKFIEDIERMLPCKAVYYPKDEQILVFINVNNKDCKLCYGEAFIECNWPDTIFAVVEDDLFRIGKEVNISGRV